MSLSKDRASAIELDHPILSVRRQCTLLNINRSTVYYQAKTDSKEELQLKKCIDEIFTARPFYGVRRITYTLQIKNFHIGRKKVTRLMREMGLVAAYPKPKLSKNNLEDVKYPYLLRNLKIDHCNQVWSTDITYVRMDKGFLYLVAIIDWHSRAVLAWELSNTMEPAFCIKALRQAIRLYGAPEIFNSDQGSQFTCTAFASELQTANIRISRDGRGRCLDNIFVERLWRSVKYEEIYLKDYLDGRDARRQLAQYFEFYNEERPHQSLKYQTPMKVYREAVATKAA